MAPDASIQYLNLVPSSDQALAALAPPIQAWFRATHPRPTFAQRLAWPGIQQEKHFLLAAPTGSGKTLAAALPIISTLVSDQRPRLACLYVAPLKALCADVAKNLTTVLDQLRGYLPEDAPLLRVGVRTGDTGSTTRRHFLEEPPALLLTTPESLAVMLTQPAALDMLHTIRWVIVDEVHAFAGDQRGADLSLALERLEQVVAAAGGRPPQRLGLSATCVPLATAASYLAGAGRPCLVAQVADQTPFTLAVELLPPPAVGAGFLARLLNRLEPELEQHKTTLLFTDIRSLAERVTWALKKRFPDWAEAIAVHHSSLAAGQRRQVEDRLKRGTLRVVVSSTSLELGVDIGSVEQVVLIHPPGGVARLLQRLGRSGHGPGRLRKGLVLTSQPAELLDAAVSAAAGRAAQLEPLAPRPAPLDVLCQHLVGLAMTGWHTVNEVYDLVCRAYPYRDLSQADLHACLDYLSGRHPDGHDWLPARLRWHGDRFTIIDQRTASLLRRNLGTIVAEEPRSVRLIVDTPTESPVRCPSKGQRNISLGNLDEDYADHLQPGDRFMLDGRCLEVRRQEGRAVMVEERTTGPLPPRWGSSPTFQTAALAQRLFVERARAVEAWRDSPGALRRFLTEEWQLTGPAALEVTRWLIQQETVSEVPSPARQLVEMVAVEGSREYYWHTPLNRPGNAALASLLAWRLQNAFKLEVTAWPANLGFLLRVASTRMLDANIWRGLASLDCFTADLAEAWRDSQALRERFARTAQVGLMVLRNPVGGRRKVGGRFWVQRNLFEQIQDEAPRFVLLRQALHELAEDGAARAQAQQLVHRLDTQPLICRPLAQPSPLAAAWFEQPFIEEASVTPREEVLYRLAQTLTLPHVAG